MIAGRTLARAWTAGEVAALVGAVVEGDADHEIRAVADLESAGPDDLSFCTGGRWARVLDHTRAGVVILADGAVPSDTVALRVEHPRLAFARALGTLVPLARPAPGVHPTAVVDPTASVEGASIDAYAVIDAGAVVGQGTWVQAHAYIGPGVTLGRDGRVGPHAVVLEGTVVGDRVWLHPGSVVGADGFGHVPTADGPLRVQHLGHVLIEDDVEIGANACVDRAALGRTRIGRGSRLDNLVQVAHGVELGEACLLAAFAGVAGGAKLGDRVIMGGRSAVVDGILVGDDAVFAGLASASKDVPAGRQLGGSPARRYREWLREFAALRELPTALRTLSRLERRLEALEAATREEDP